MIVVDNDVISYFWLEADRTTTARAVRERDSDWVAPMLWRSEFRNVLYQLMQYRGLPLSEASQIADLVEDDMAESTYEVDTNTVLRLIEATGHSAYDCEYVALAQALGVPLVTGDTTVAEEFPGTATLLEAFVDAP